MSRTATGKLGEAAVFLDGAYEDVGYYLTRARGADLVVAADGAASFLLAHGILPDVVVGDLDSLPEDALERLLAGDVEVMRFPVRKDVTDGELAVAEAVRRGAHRLVLAGALGALDHTLGHVAILRRLAAAGVEAYLISPRLVVKVLVAPDERSLDSAAPTRVSLVALGGDAVVTLKGLEYPLVRARLPWDTCLGLGNEVASARPMVTVHEGTVAVLVASGDEAFGERQRA